MSPWHVLTIAAAALAFVALSAVVGAAVVVRLALRKMGLRR